MLEQQVSLDSARAAVKRLKAALPDLEARTLARTTPATLRGLGVTRQKASYVTELAREEQQGRLQLDSLAGRDDGSVREHLVGFRGIGPWTADIYLILALKRHDVLPVADLALRHAFAAAYDQPPDSQRLIRHAETWQPWRAVAARILWHDYLRTRGRTFEPD